MSGDAKSDKIHTQHPFSVSYLRTLTRGYNNQMRVRGQERTTKAEHTVKGWLTHYKSDDDSFDRPSSIDWDRRHLEVKHTQIDSFDTSCSIDTDSFGPELI